MSMDNFRLFNPTCSSKTKPAAAGPGHNKLGSCLFTLRTSSRLRWGVRKKVIYLQRNNTHPAAAAEEVVRKKEEGSNSNKRLREEKEYGARKTPKLRITEEEVEKRFNLRVQMEKQFNVDERKVQDPCASNGTNEGFSRWSHAQIEHAGKSLVEVMRKMGATWRSPVPRHDLRMEARKRIGNLGLLDHLLKHMAGVVVSDCEERFVRRHNSDGVIEYWLEPADLVQIRRGAGITDLCWVPPAGWEPENAGSKCTCQGRCEEIAYELKAEIELLRSEIEELKSLKIKENEKLRIDQFQAQLQLEAFEQAWQERHGNLLMEHQKLQKEFTSIFSSFLTMKEEMSLLKVESDKRRANELAMVVKVPNQANLVSEMQFVPEKVKGKPKKKPVTQKVFRNYNPWSTFLQPKLPHASSSSPHSISFATSAPSQLLMLPSPTSPLPPPRPAFFYPSSMEIQCQNQTQAQSQAVHAECQSRHMAPRPVAEYLSTGMMYSGASQTESDELASAIAPHKGKV